MPVFGHHLIFLNSLIKVSFAEMFLTKKISPAYGLAFNKRDKGHDNYYVALLN